MEEGLRKLTIPKDGTAPEDLQTRPFGLIVWDGRSIILESQEKDVLLTFCYNMDRPNLKAKIKELNEYYMKEGKTQFKRWEELRKVALSMDVTGLILETELNILEEAVLSVEKELYQFKKDVQTLEDIGEAMTEKMKQLCERRILFTQEQQVNAVAFQRSRINSLLKATYKTMTEHNFKDYLLPEYVKVCLTRWEKMKGGGEIWKNSVGDLEFNMLYEGLYKHF